MEDLEETFEDFENYSYVLDYSSPASSLEERPPLEAVHWVCLALYCVAFALGIPGNATVIWFTGFKWKKTVSTFWFLNLAVADFVFLLFLPLYISYVAMNFHWPFGRWLCKANSFMAQLNMFASVFFLTVISLDRCLQLAHPVLAQRHRTLRSSQRVTACIWLLASLLGGPSLYFRDTVQVGNHTVCYHNFHEHDYSLAVLRHHALAWAKFVIGYLAPLLTMSVCYARLLAKVKRQQGGLASSGYSLTALALVLAFLACWTPYHVFSLWELLAHQGGSVQQVLRAGLPLATALAFLNSCLNPLLYVLISKRFQARFRASVAEILKFTLWEVSCSGGVGEQLRGSETKTSGLQETTAQ